MSCDMQPFTPLPPTTAPSPPQPQPQPHPQRASMCNSYTLVLLVLASLVNILVTASQKSNNNHGVTQNRKMTTTATSILTT